MTRPSNFFMDQILGFTYPIGTVGEMAVIDYMGNDEQIVCAARQSVNGETRDPDSDRRLIRYLMRKHHTSPFEMCELKVHLRVPLFVARHLVRHRTANINELSGRFTTMPDKTWVPGKDDVCLQGNMKQGRTEPIEDADHFIAAIEDQYYLTRMLYEEMQERGIANEVSRTVLPVSTYVDMFMKNDLHNWLHFLQLRMADNTQKETREVAKAIGRVVERWVPTTWEAFMDYRFNALTLSATAQKLLRQKLAGQEPDLTLLSKTERGELAGLL